MIKPINLDVEEVAESVPPTRFAGGTARISRLDVPRKVQIDVSRPGLFEVEFIYPDQEAISNSVKLEDDERPEVEMELGVYSGKILHLRFRISDVSDQAEQLKEIARRINRAARLSPKMNQGFNFVGVAQVLNAIGTGEIPKDGDK